MSWATYWWLIALFLICFWILQRKEMIGNEFIIKYLLSNERGKLEIVELMQREWDLNVLLISFCKYYKTLFLCLLWTWEVVKLLSILLSSLQIAFVVVHWTLSFATTRFFFDYYRSWIIAFIRTSSSSVDRQINFLCIFNLITVVVARHTLKSIINTWADRTQRSTWRE